MLVRPLLLKPRLIVLATLCERLAKTATPLRAVALNVPCKVPLPALRAAVTTVELSLLRKGGTSNGGTRRLGLHGQFAGCRCVDSDVGRGRSRQGAAAEIHRNR